MNYARRATNLLMRQNRSASKIFFAVQAQLLCLTENSIRHPRYVGIASAVIFFVALLGATRFSVSADARVFFPETSPELQVFKEFEGKYGNRSHLVVALHFSSSTALTPDNLRVIRSLTEQLWKVDGVVRVDSLTNYIDIRAHNDALIVSDLIPDDFSLSGKRVAIILQEKENVVGSLISRDWTTTALTLSFDLTSAGYDPRRILKETRASVQEAIEGNHGVTVAYGGRVAISDAFRQAARNDFVTLIPLTYIVVVIVVALFLRSVRYAVVLGVVAALVSVTSFGLAGYLNIEVNAATSASVTILYALSIVSMIHVVAHVALPAPQDLGTRRQLLRESVEKNVAPVSATLVTSAIGFATLATADAPPFVQMGLIVAFGCGLALLATVTILPATLIVVAGSRSVSNKVLTKLVKSAGDFVASNPGRSVLWSCLLLVPAAVGLLRVTVDDDFNRYLEAGNSFRVDTEFIESKLSGTTVVEIDLQAKRPFTVNSREYLNDLLLLERWLLAQPFVGNVRSLAPILRQIHSVVGISSISLNSLDSETIAQYLFLYELGLPSGKDLNSLVALDRTASRVSVTLKGATSSVLSKFESDFEQWADAYALSIEESRITGLPLLYARLTKANIDSLIGGCFAALLLISGVLVIVLGDWKLGVASLIPNLLPVVSAFGYWLLFNDSIGVSVAIVGAVILGVIVDDTIHISWHYRRELSAKRNAPAAIRAAIENVGPPMLCSSVALVAGFCCLGFSEFEINASMGALSAIVVGLALALDWFLYGAILAIVGRQESA